MKILILSWEIYPIYCGGLGVLVRHLVNELQAQGHEVITLVPDSNMEYIDINIINLKPEVDKYLAKRKPIEGLEFKLKNFNLKNFKNVEHQVTKVYPNNTPQVSQAYAYAVQDYLESMSFDMILGMDWVTIPTFQLLKNNNNPTPFAFYINGTEVDRNYGAIMSKTSTHIHNLEKKFYNQADSIYTVSNVTKKILTSKLNCKAKKITVIHNDSEVKLIAENQFQRQPKKILFLGRLAYQKGLRYLVMAFRKLTKLDSSAQLVIVGNGSEKLMINKYLDKYNLHSSIKLIDWLEGEDKHKEYMTSSLFVMPSVSEPFGLTAIEAIRLGLPTIASTRCGFTDIIPSTPTFEYKNTKAFARLMNQLINSAADLDQLIDIQRQELSTHNWSDQVTKLTTSIESKITSNLLTTSNVDVKVQ
jgi:glycogen synthase